ncbi:DnaJ family domain-containing protein [Cohnella massiliensis]|uniref:DnaJ family domain-containing protein n=1 Tax=Cohnella massiliensis TaxID=1816691 RepID=UPI0009BB5AB0|nr:DnaJ family domain-containing protein [Cohnella massiliensis]
MDWFQSIANERIIEAQRKGEFDDLPGKGKPLPPDELASVPEELRMGFRLLKNAGALPPEMELRKEMVTLEDLLRCCRDDNERAELRGRLAEKRFRYRMMMEQRGWSGIGAFGEYEDRIERKLAGEAEPAEARNFEPKSEKQPKK